MEKIKFLGMASLMVLATCMTSCSSDDNNGDEEKPSQKYTWSTDGGIKACDHLLFSEVDNSENVNGTQIGNGDAEFVFKGKQTLKKGTYILKGWVYIANGAELTIEPGTIIKGDKQTKASLIAERGGKLIAQGSASEPIVFTSEEAPGNRKPGDWGGVILCGKARNNQTEMQIEGGPRTKHGGNDDADNSGVLSYVRIEFAGYPFNTDQEINGLTLGSVGSGTKIDHVQVSYSNDDSYEWFGGTVNCKYLVAYHAGTTTSIQIMATQVLYSMVSLFVTPRLLINHKATASRATTTLVVQMLILTPQQHSATSPLLVQRCKQA